MRLVKSPTNEFFTRQIVNSELSYRTYELMLTQDRHMRLTFIEDTTT